MAEAWHHGSLRIFDQSEAVVRLESMTFLHGAGRGRSKEM